MQPSKAEISFLPAVKRARQEPFIPFEIGVELAQPNQDLDPEPEHKPLTYKNEELETKRVEALRRLGIWYRLHPQTRYVDRGEHFLTLYFREFIKRRPTISLISGTTMLSEDVKRVVNGVPDGIRVYVGDFKILGEGRH